MSGLKSSSAPSRNCEPIDNSLNLCLSKLRFLGSFLLDSHFGQPRSWPWNPLHFKLCLVKICFSKNLFTNFGLSRKHTHLYTRIQKAIAKSPKNRDQLLYKCASMCTLKDIFCTRKGSRIHEFTGTHTTIIRFGSPTSSRAIFSTQLLHGANGANLYLLQSAKLSYVKTFQANKRKRCVNKN